MNTALILAAGLGTRMRPLTDHTAKPLLHYHAERLIERHLRLLSAAGFSRAVINVSWQGKQLRQLIGDGNKFGIQVLYSCEDDSPLETASGIARASTLIGDTRFALINGDIWTDLEYKRLRETEYDPSIVLVENPPHNPQGDFAIDKDQQVSNCGENMLTYAGIGVFNCSLVQSASNAGSKLAAALRLAAKQNALRGIVHKGIWVDVGSPSALKSQVSNRQK